MVGYKLPKNDWVTPFFVIFRSVREKLLVTVFFDHPVDKVDKVDKTLFHNLDTVDSLSIKSELLQGDRERRPAGEGLR